MMMRCMSISEGTTRKRRSTLSQYFLGLLVLFYKVASGVNGDSNEYFNVVTGKKDQPICELCADNSSRNCSFATRYKAELASSAGSCTDRSMDIQCNIQEKATIDVASSEEEETSSSHALSPCSLYLAESTIPGAGLGMFSGIDLPVGNVIGDGDVMFPIVDRTYHLQPLVRAIREALPDINKDFSKILANPLRDYAWIGEVMGMYNEASNSNSGTADVSAFAPGADAAINCHLALTNVDKRIPLYDTTGLHRSQDPGAGAFSPYHGSQTFVTHAVIPGEELFKFYGDEWFTSRKVVFGMIPLSGDYHAAEKLLREFHDKFDNQNAFPEAVQKDLWQLMTNFSWPSRTLNAIPKDHVDLQTVRDHGLREIYRPGATRTLTDLSQHGRCLDNIASRESTIRQAGRGAFATRFLPKGITVVGSPLLFFPTAHFFEMYKGNWTTKDDAVWKKVVHHQIMYNYCYHHVDSSIFLCPYGTGINYINHGNKTRANVRLVWAADGEMGHQDKWLHQSPKNMMMHQVAPGLFVDVVATRDISPGDELFLDYGHAWETAWERHVADWGTKYNNFSKDYQSARDWNIANPDTMLRMQWEQKKHPYPPNFELRCLHNIQSYKYSHKEAQEMWHKEGTFVPGNECRIIDRAQSQGDYYYKVIYKERPKNRLKVQDKQKEWLASNWIVRGALKFVDVPYSTDMWLEGAFRHPIGIPDDIFPDAWRGEFITAQDLI